MWSGIEFSEYRSQWENVCKLATTQGWALYIHLGNRPTWSKNLPGSGPWTHAWLSCCEGTRTRWRSPRPSSSPACCPARCRCPSGPPRHCSGPAWGGRLCCALSWHGGWTRWGRWQTWEHRGPASPGSDSASPPEGGHQGVRSGKGRTERKGEERKKTEGVEKSEGVWE